jgi:hypothetical protein
MLATDRDALIRRPPQVKATPLLLLFVRPWRPPASGSRDAVSALASADSSRRDRTAVSSRSDVLDHPVAPVCSTVSPSSVASARYRALW